MIWILYTGFVSFFVKLTIPIRSSFQTSADFSIPADNSTPSHHPSRRCAIEAHLPWLCSSAASGSLPCCQTHVCISPFRCSRLCRLHVAACVMSCWFCPSPIMYVHHFACSCLLAEPAAVFRSIGQAHSTLSLSRSTEPVCAALTLSSAQLTNLISLSTML
jgi:hypothetical protein